MTTRTTGPTVSGPTVSASTVRAPTVRASTVRVSTVSAAVAVALAASALSPVYHGFGWLPRVLGAVLVVCLAGLAARRVGSAAPWPPVLQAVVLTVYLAAAFVPSTLYGGWVPTWRSVDALRELIASGLDDVAALAAPVPTTPGLVLLAALSVGAIAIVVDLIAVGLGYPAVAGLPLLVLYTVASTVRAGGAGWLSFILGAIGWLALLLAHGKERAATPLPGPDVDPTRGDGAASRVGRRIGVAALGVALVVPAALPGLDARLLSGSGDGTGQASRQGRTSTTYNPITQLRGQLNAPEPTELLRYTTTDTQPDYLRLTTLDTFDGTSWSASQLRGDPQRDAVQSGIALPETVVNTVTVRDRIAISTLATKWLPVPFPPTGIALAGPWVWDRTAETAFSAVDDTRDLRQPYEVTAARVVIPPGSLTETGSRPLEIARYAEPVSLSPYVAREVRAATAGASTDFAKVQAIQQYFLNSARFAYSTNADAPRFDTDNALERFLRSGRGFCEQYASAMAAMVRFLALPARVAVGFTPGTKTDSGAYLVTTSDAHAWPEVWFAGAGWIRFEPTPRSGVTSVPAYAQPQTGSTIPGEGVDSAAPTGSPRVAGKDLDLALEPRGQQGQPAALPVPPPVSDRGLPSLRETSVVLALLCLSLPALLALARRQRRLRAPTPLAGWAQVVDDAADLGHRFRAAESPRASATRLGAAYAFDGPAVQALRRLALGAEQARYGRPATDQRRSDAADRGLVDDVATVRTALRRGAGPAQRIRALLLPPATVRWLGAGIGSRVADLLDSVDEAVTGLGRAVRRRPDHPAGIAGD